jgi:leucyl-tRNA synthetase
VPALTASNWPEGTPPQWRCANLLGEEAAASPATAVAAYVARTASLSERQRQTEAPKSAVFLGSYAINPASGAKMPILISDYVLASYGTGAIMAVPAHDQRDYELAAALSLPNVTVVRPSEQWLRERVGATAARSRRARARHMTATGAHQLNWRRDLTGHPEHRGCQGPRGRRLSGHGARRISYKLRDWLFSAAVLG